jgi:Resolvase, N terminal domain
MLVANLLPGIHIVQTSTAAGKAFLDMLGVFAELETNLRKERQLEGIAKAKAAGICKGRPASIDPARVQQLKAEGWGPMRARPASSASVAHLSIALWRVERMRAGTCVRRSHCWNVHTKLKILGKHQSWSSRRPISWRWLRS